MAAPIHSRFPPSSAHRWVECTASIGFIEANRDKLPPEGSAFAEEGTTAHELAARILTGQQRLIDGGDVDMMIHVREYVNFVRDKVQEGARLMVERRVPLFYMPEQRGTTDAAIIAPKSIYIADLKYGAGVSVYAKDNPQLAIYAESLIRELELIEEVTDDTLVTLAIFQPRDRNDSNPVRLWALRRDELRNWVKYIEEAKDRILKGEVEFKADPDKQCRFCPASGICPTYAAYGLQPIIDVPAATVLKTGQIPALVDPSTLSREVRNKVLTFKSALTDWLSALEAQEVHELSTGAPPLQFKLVEGKTNRKWKSDTDAGTFLLTSLPRETVFPPSDPISPAQAEKILKRALGDKFDESFQNRLSSLIIKPEGKPTLVPISDKRPALELNPTAGLADIDVI